MKKINVFLVMCFMALPIFTLSCSKDDLDPKDDSNLPDTPIQFEGSISRHIAHDGYLSIVYDFQLKNTENDNADANEAIVTVNGETVPLLVAQWMPGVFQLSSLPEQYYTNGADYTVVLQYQGKTYTETLKAPGGWSANEGITTLSWENHASTVSIDVSYLFGSTTYTSASIPMTSIKSPFNIPTDKAYPNAGNTYQVVASVQNFHQGFDNLVGWNCRFWIDDGRTWRITK